MPQWAHRSYWSRTARAQEVEATVSSVYPSDQSSTAPNESDQTKAKFAALEEQYDRVCQELQLVKANLTYFNEYVIQTQRGNAMKDRENMTSATDSLQTDREACPPTPEDKKLKPIDVSMRQSQTVKGVKWEVLPKSSRSATGSWHHTMSPGRYTARSRRPLEDRDNQDDEKNISIIENGIWRRTE